jgi:tetratricopeptide (TPR) repeat protein
MRGGRTDRIRYSAFISYNHEDLAWARWLHRELERYRLPKSVLGHCAPWGPTERQLPPVFRDREELAASANLANSVREALADSSSLIVICSTNGARSRWVNEEVKEFASLGRRDRIQCLIVPEAGEGEGNPRPETELFPPALLELGIQPLAADARKSGDGKRAAFLKLVAGVIGVRYDELRQREQVRRHKRLLALASAASAGFVLMTGLAGFALVSRAQAVHQRDIAREKTMTAERTTDFVKGLFQVSNPSESEGQNISAREVLDRGAREIRGELGNEPDVKAELISTLSEVYMGLGSFRRADDLIRGSFSLRVRSQETRARQLGVLGASSFLQGDYDQAQKIFGAGLRRLGPPKELTDASIYSDLLTGRAEALAELDRYDEARMLISQALAWDRAGEGERSPGFARDLESLGLTDQLANEYDRSNRSYLRALSIRVAVQGGLHPKVSDDLNQLASNAYFQRNSAASEAYLRRVLALDEKVIGLDHPNFAASLNNLARLLIEERKFGEALPLLNRSVNIYVAQRQDTHADLSFIFSNRALALRGVGQDAEAEADFRRGLRAAEAHKNRLIAPILTDLADLLCTHGKAEEALQMLARAAPIMRARYPDDAWRSAWVENTRGACLVRQHDSSGASVIEGSAPVLLKRWKPDSLYGFEVEQRLRSVQ